MTINFNDVWEDDRADQEEGGELEGKDHLVISSYNDNKYNYNIIIIVIGPESDHWLCLSLTHSLTHSLTP